MGWRPGAVCIFSEIVFGPVSMRDVVADLVLRVAALVDDSRVDLAVLEVGWERVGQGQRSAHRHDHDLGLTECETVVCVNDMWRHPRCP